MKQNQKGFAFLELVFMAGVLVILGVVGWTIRSRHNQNNSQPSQSIGSNVREETITAKEGTQTIKMLSGRTIVKLPSGDILRFGHAGSETSVPDFIFGSDYMLNDIHKINWLPIKKTLTTYSNGYQYTVTNQRCSTERKVDIDVEITVVTDCTIEVQTTKTDAPHINLISLAKPLSITERQGSPLRDVLSTNPYLFVGASNMRVTKTGDGTKVYSDSGDWGVYIITNFGVETVKYTAKELYARQTKSVTIGSAKVDIVIDALTCTPAYSPELGCKSQYATVYDKIDFTIKYSLADGKQDVKVIDYEE